MRAMRQCLARARGARARAGAWDVFKGIDADDEVSRVHGGRRRWRRRRARRRARRRTDDDDEHEHQDEDAEAADDDDED